MSHRRSESPTEWSAIPGLFKVPGSEDVYVALVGDRTSGSDVWVWHWHTPDVCRHCLKPSDPDGDHSCTCPLKDDECAEHPSLDRWQLSACGAHTVESWEPLTLSPSLACDEGCPNHGWIKNGVWTNA